MQGLAEKLGIVFAIDGDQYRYGTHERPPFACWATARYWRAMDSGINAASDKRTPCAASADVSATRQDSRVKLGDSRKVVLLIASRTTSTKPPEPVVTRLQPETAASSSEIPNASVSHPEKNTFVLPRICMTSPADIDATKCTRGCPFAIFFSSVSHSPDPTIIASIVASASSTSITAGKNSRTRFTG